MSDNFLFWSENYLSNLLVVSFNYPKMILLLNHGLPLALALSNGEAIDLGLDLCPPFAHVVFNVEHEGVLAKVSVHDLARSLQTHGWVQVGLQ